MTRDPDAARHHAEEVLRVRQLRLIRDRQLTELEGLTAGVRESSSDKAVVAINLGKAQALVAELSKSQAELQEAVVLANSYGSRLGITPIKIIRRGN